MGTKILVPRKWLLILLWLRLGLMVKIRVSLNGMHLSKYTVLVSDNNKIVCVLYYSCVFGALPVPWLIYRRAGAGVHWYTKYQCMQTLFQPRQCQNRSLHFPQSCHCSFTLHSTHTMRLSCMLSATVFTICIWVYRARQMVEARERPRVGELQREGERVSESHRGKEGDNHSCVFFACEDCCWASSRILPSKR